MGIRGFIVGLAGNFIQAAVLAYLTNSVRVAVISFTIGLALLIVAAFIRKKEQLPTVPATPVHQDVKQEANPQISQQFSPQFNPTFSPQQTVVIGGGRYDAAEKFKHSREETVITEYLKDKHPTVGYTIDEIAKDKGFTMPDVREIMERLRARSVVFRVNLNEAVGGVAYILDELHRSQLSAIPTLPRYNIQLSDVGVSTSPDFTGHSIKTAYAIFENKHIDGQKLIAPTVKGRLIFKHTDGHQILDLSDVAWWPDEDQSANFPVNSPRQLLLFFTPSPDATEANLWARTVTPKQIVGHHRFVLTGDSHPISEQIGSIEVQLVTESECLYRKLLKFEDEGGGFPKFVGAENIK